MRRAERIMPFMWALALVAAPALFLAGCGGDSAKTETVSEEAKQAQQDARNAWEKTKTDPASKAPAPTP